jgi:hypothetical protein
LVIEVLVAVDDAKMALAVAAFVMIKFISLDGMNTDLRSWKILYTTPL